MASPLIFDQRTLKRIPPLFVFILILMLGLPVVLLNYFETDFSAFTRDLSVTTGLGTLEIEAQIRGYFRQTLLEWSAFSLAAITVLLAFTQYRLTNDKVALVIGLVVLFSGSVQALHTLIIDGLQPNFLDQKNLDAFIWTFSNTTSGLIFIAGLLLILEFKEKTVRVSTLFLLNFLLLLIAFSLIYYAASRAELPTMWFEFSILSRPYELIYLGLFLGLIIFIYPKVYEEHPNILTNCIFYMAITQIVIALYIMVLSSSPYDSAYNIAYFLKIVFYFIPFSCLIINYVYSYNAVLEAQGRLKLSQEKLKYMASHDALTNLYNRREFESLLEISIANHNREGTSFALFVIDIDNFKTINDTLGHVIGDEYIKKFSEHLETLTRKGDVISRIGGDEYTLITGRIESSTGVRKIAERMVEQLNAPLVVGDKLLTCTVSIGIAIYPSDGETTEELLKHADIAMYSSKKSGKNTYRFYEEKLSYLQNRQAEIESYLRTALKNNEFNLYFQPMYNLITKEIIGTEVLLRWHNEVLGEIPPNEFIPVAEQTGWLIPIGEWVLNKASKQAQEWLSRYKKPLVFSVNVSPIQFENHNFFDKLREILKENALPPEYFEIEITERLLMNPNPEVMSCLDKISGIGVNIAIDDFGMGYTSLTKLKSLPIKTMKIDKFFISEIHDAEHKVIVIDTIIKLSQELGMSVMAEGIETQEQIDYLIAHNCLLGQGFFLNKPLSSEHFEQLVYQKDTL
ncbi:bifunctional diguanylate cyclase/phosphodiesterase [Legionella impletisoli]|uniref:Histidine kinase n=1 Tax=Legionella impletisoli TaxID=343510 RepID=A0A917JVC6_9GAMM|nr:EAL domain-containing protein [Legionella impletisoli]GGI88608.1 histidine kinase [Legionella impletisoli]